MIPPTFDYLRPKTIPEAIALLQQYGDDAKILSGGQSLIPLLKLRFASRPLTARKSKPLRCPRFTSWRTCRFAMSVVPKLPIRR